MWDYVICYATNKPYFLKNKQGAAFSLKGVVSTRARAEICTSNFPPQHLVTLQGDMPERLCCEWKQKYFWEWHILWPYVSVMKDGTDDNI